MVAPFRALAALAASSDLKGDSYRLKDCDLGRVPPAGTEDT